VKRVYQEEDQNGSVIGNTKETLSSVKLEKNSKGYNWELRLDFDRHEDGAVEETLKELEEINKKLLKTYGGESNG